MIAVARSARLPAARASAGSATRYVVASRDLRLRHHRRRVPARGRARASWCVLDATAACAAPRLARAGEDARTAASSSTSTSRGPTAASSARTWTRCAAARAPPRRGAPGRRRHRDRGARLEQLDRARLRRGVGHPVRARPDPQPLRRAHLHPAAAGAARLRACASSSTRCAACSRASGSSWSTTRSCAAHDAQARAHAAPGRRARGAPAHRLAARSPIRASTASTRRRAAS